MKKILDFLYTFYKKYYSADLTDTSVSVIGSYKILSLGALFIVGLSLGLGADGDFPGIAFNIVASHILSTIAAVIISRVKPRIFGNRTEISIAGALLAPLFLVSWLFGGLSKLSKNANTRDF